MATAARAARPVRTLCAVLHTTGCRISEALALTPEHVDLPGKAVVFETLKKRRRGVYRAVPVPPALLDQLDLVHGLREALKRGRGHAERPLWPCSRMTVSGAWRACLFQFDKDLAAHSKSSLTRLFGWPWAMASRVAVR
jgi:integrase/recombinase XerD